MGPNTGLGVVGLPRLAYVEVSCSNNVFFFLLRENFITLITFLGSWRTRSPLFTDLPFVPRVRALGCLLASCIAASAHLLHSYPEDNSSPWICFIFI